MEGADGDLEQYKDENQTLLLQVSWSPPSLTRTRVWMILKVVVKNVFVRWRRCRCRWRNKLVSLKNR